MKPLVAALLALLALLTASAAQGAQRYAAPSGAGTSCSQASPCSLAEAVSKAAVNDEVIVTGGTYSVPAAITSPAEGLHVHGDFSGPMPRIDGAVTGNVPIALGVKGRLEFLDIANVAANPIAAICPFNGRLDRLHASASGSASATGVIQGSPCEVRDSLITATAPNAVAIAASGTSPSPPGLVRNVTALAEGTESTGIRSSYFFPILGSYTLDLKNVIADGDKADLEALSSGFGPGNIVVSHSSFDLALEPGEAEITGSDNQTAPPLFLDAAGGDYRPAVGSPTIDAGSTDQIGSLDLAGNPRTVGVAPDIGAFEFVPAVPAVPAAAAIQSLSISPKIFRAVNAGGAILSATRKKKAPIGTTVKYALSAAGTAGFSVERAIKGRKVGKKCVKQTRANRDKKRCALFKKVKGGFTHVGATGPNRFKFSGRLRGKALKPGRYRLVGTSGDSVRRAGFKIVR